MTKVSVIMPVFNTPSDFLYQAVNSVMFQSVADFELLIIDDGSTNNETLAVLNELKTTDKRIKIISQPHSNSGNARNLGILSSLGETISFLDSDDFYPDEDTLKTLYDTLKNENVLIIGGYPLELKSDGSMSVPYFNYGNLEEFFADKCVDYADYQFPWWYWCFLFDGDFIRKNNFIFPSLKRYQDPLWFVSVMDSAKKFYALNRVTYIHRDRGSLHTLNKELFDDHVNGISELLKYSAKNNLLKLHNLLKDVFFSYDITLFNDVKDISDEDKQRYISIINSSLID